MLLCKTPCRIQGVYQERTNTLTFVLKGGGGVGGLFRHGCYTDFLHCHLCFKIHTLVIIIIIHSV